MPLGSNALLVRLRCEKMSFKSRSEAVGTLSRVLERVWKRVPFQRTRNGESPTTKRAATVSWSGSSSSSSSSSSSCCCCCMYCVYDSYNKQTASTTVNHGVEMFGVAERLHASAPGGEVQQHRSGSAVVAAR